MTTPDNYSQTSSGRSAEKLLRLTAQAWSDALAALLDSDPDAARRVLRGSRARRSAVGAAQTYVRREVAIGEVHGHCLVQAFNSLQLVADISHIEDLLIHLARRVLAHRESLPAPDQPDVDALRRAGAHRLNDLADGLSTPVMDSDYLLCGCELIDVLERLVQRIQEPGSTSHGTSAGLCVALAASLLEASRHATRAA
ncbi:hypothetical protein [Nocardioides sp. LHG3406-4]|uniref:hypothetical protein n=1 Tax=Nocardioides sp. LHG3406-4 TaxID=2804575 RepID=UPI003CEF0400